MVLVVVSLCVLLLATSSLSTPNCTGVQDFGDCHGNTTNFCPWNISCQCKNEQPFCSCHYYRVGGKDFWYMGPKCNHLWNTVDFILVATIPGVALVLIVTAIFLAVYSCMNKKPRKQPTLPYPGARHNPSFTADPHLGHPGPARNRDVWTGQIPKAAVRRQDFDEDSFPSQERNYSSVYSQPLRTPESGFIRPQQESFEYPSRNLPYPDYAEARPYRKY